MEGRGSVEIHARIRMTALVVPGHNSDVEPREIDAELREVILKIQNRDIGPPTHHLQVSVATLLTEPACVRGVRGARGRGAFGAALPYSWPIGSPCIAAFTA